MFEGPARRYRTLFQDNWPATGNSEKTEDVGPFEECVILNRTGNSHRGIAQYRQVRALLAGSANQDFLEEIGHLGSLEYLELAWPTTAKDLSPLRNLKELRVLKIDSPRNIVDFSIIAQLPKLERLFIENAKHMSGLDWIEPLRDRLTVLGIEGSMYTKQKIPSLAPLQGFALQALFLTSTRMGDQSFVPLHDMQTLRYLGTALNAPRDEFEALHTALPDLQCDWFNPEAWEPFRNPRPAKRG